VTICDRFQTIDDRKTRSGRKRSHAAALGMDRQGFGTGKVVQQSVDHRLVPHGLENLVLQAFSRTLGRGFRSLGSPMLYSVELRARVAVRFAASSALLL